MPLFRIAVGYRTEHRRSEPVILAGSLDLASLQGAVDSAPADLQRFEVGTFHFHRKAFRSGATPVPAPVTGSDTQEVDVAELIRQLGLSRSRNGELEQRIAELEAAAARPPDTSPLPMPAASIPAPVENAGAGDADVTGDEQGDAPSIGSPNRRRRNP